jgi:hypothetical protein
MALKDPVAVYNAAHNDEAHHVRTLLVNSGVEAYVTEDLCVVGVSLFGPLAEIHKPQVWIDRDQIDRAGPFLAEYQQKKEKEMIMESAPGPADETPIDVVCEECGKITNFPSGLRGHVQTCPHCGAFVDVGGPDDMDYGESEETETTG